MKIKGPAGTDISEEDVRDLAFDLPQEEKRQVLATTDGESIGLPVPRSI